MSNKLKRTGSVISALTLVIAQAGVAPSAYAAVSVELAERCDFYANITDREELQRLLEAAIDRNPDDECIPYLLDRLGPGPLAVVDTETPNGTAVNTDTPSGGDDTPSGGLTTTSYSG